MTTASELAQNNILRHIAESLDISPSDYKRAVDSYEAVGKWLESGFRAGAYPGSNDKPTIFPQGSIRLGTIVRPLREGAEADFDIDLVCELSRPAPVWNEESAREVKLQVGDRLRMNSTYADMIDDEGKRCWTLNYAQNSAGTGFHLDILPSIPDPTTGSVVSMAYLNNPHTREEFTTTTIAITHQDNGRYDWRSSNPRGYARWFDEKNVTFANVAVSQKQALFETSFVPSTNRRIFASVDDVPNQLVRTPLQRTIQILKRHRDHYFRGNPKFKPISIIITTLSAHLYRGEADIYSTLTNIVNKLVLYEVLYRDASARLDPSVASRNLIRKLSDGRWQILNPVNPDENFADRWHEDSHARAEAFFNWVKRVQQDFQRMIQIPGTPQLLDFIEETLGKRI